MSRFDDVLNEEAAEQTHVPFVLFADFYFLSGHVRVSSAARNYTWGGYTWTGLGTLAGIDPVKESSDLRPNSLKYTLSGVNPSLLSIALTEAYQNRDGSLYLAFVNDNGDLVTDPQLIREERMDRMGINRDTKSASISLTCENRLTLWNKANGSLYTHEWQRLIDNTDDFFSLMSTLDNKVIKWGEKPA